MVGAEKRVMYREGGEGKGCNIEVIKKRNLY